MSAIFVLTSLVLELRVTSLQVSASIADDAPSFLSFSHFKLACMQDSFLFLAQSEKMETSQDANSR